MVDDLFHFEIEETERDARFHRRMARTEGLITGALAGSAVALSIFDPLSAIVPAAVGFFASGTTLGDKGAADLGDVQAETMRETADELPGPQNRVDEAQA